MMLVHGEKKACLRFSKFSLTDENYLSFDDRREAVEPYNVRKLFSIIASRIDLREILTQLLTDVLESTT